MDPHAPRPPRRGFFRRRLGNYVDLVSHEPDKEPIPGVALIGLAVMLAGLAVAFRVLF